MKKQYMKPSCEVLHLEPCTLLAGSAQGTENRDFDGTKIDGPTIDYDDKEKAWAGSKEHGSVWDD